MELLANLLDLMSGIVWHRYVVYTILIVSIFSSFAFGFFQITKIRAIFGLSFDSSHSNLGISAFQSLMVSVGGRVGSGNLTGVTGAIIFGGPGAIFWMWIAAFFATSVSFIETVLGQLYKIQKNKQFLASPGLYGYKIVTRLTNCPKLGTIVMFVVSLGYILSFSGLILGPQANSIAQSFEPLGISKAVTGAVLVVMFLAVVLGGITRIADVAQALVPFMGALFILSGLWVILDHGSRFLDMLSLIINSAFYPHAALGGVLGVALQQGVKRGIYSNEAGAGSSGPHIGGAAHANHPAQQGLVQTLAILIDTWLICTITAFVLLITNSYNVYSPDGAAVLINVPWLDSNDIVPFLALGFSSSWGNGFTVVLMPVIMFLFTFTTMINSYYIGAVNANILSIKSKLKIFSESWAVRLAQLLSVSMIMLGCSPLATKKIWDIGLLGTGINTLLNIILVILGWGIGYKIFKDYNIKKKAGISDANITFDPKKLNIYDSDFWGNNTK